MLVSRAGMSMAVGRDEAEHAMPEGIMGAVWAFCWGAAAASGVLVGAILGLITNLRHRAIAAIMSLGAGVLLAIASVEVASEALMVVAAATAVGGIVAGAATFSIANAAFVTASRNPPKSTRRAAAPRLRSAPRLMLCQRR